MAEVNSYNKAENVAGRKLGSGYHNETKCQTIRMPVTYAAVVVNDTVATGMIIPAGAILKPPVVRNGTGTAASTLDIGLRKASDGTVVAATGLAAAHAITTASGGAMVTSGTLMAAGADARITEDSEVYFTAKGAVIAANQALDVSIYYAAP